MPTSASSSNSVFVNIQAKIEGYQSEIEKIKQALAKVGVDARIGKNISKDLESVEKQVDALGKRMTQRISSEAQLTKLGDSLQAVEEKFGQIGSQLQNIDFRDLDLNYVSTELQTLIRDAEDAKRQLDAALGSGFESIISKNPKFKDLLENYLSIDPKSLNIDNFSAVLVPALAESRQKTSDLRLEINDLKDDSRDLTTALAANNTELTKLSRIDLDASLKKNLNLNNIIDFSTRKKNDLQQLLVDGLNRSMAGLNITATTKQAATQKVLDAFIGNDPLVIQQEVSRLAATVRDILKKEVSNFNVKDFNLGVQQALRLSGNSEMQAAFGSYKSVAGMAQSADFLPFLQEKNVATLQAFENNLQALFTLFGNFGLESEKVAPAIQKVMDALLQQGQTGAYAEVNKLIQERTQNIQDQNRVLADNKSATERAIAAKTNQHTTRTSNERSLGGFITRYSNEITQLRQQNESLAQRVAALEAEKAQKTSALVDTMHETGRNVVERSNQEQERTNELINAYSAELDRVREKQRLVGKLEGVVQRWFSIYAVVRMVRQAINSVISTVKELDKTITEIAIVTDMTQKELWGQMSSYTDMARQYASSISGVYQVSQLYYQQGKLNI